MVPDYDNSMATLLQPPPLSPRLLARFISISLLWLLIMTLVDLIVLGASPWIAVLRLPPAILLLSTIRWRNDLRPAGYILCLAGQAAAVAFWSDAASPAWLLAAGALAGGLPAVLLDRTLGRMRRRSTSTSGAAAIDIDSPLPHGDAVPKAVLRINGDALQVRLGMIGNGLDRLIYGPDGARARPLLTELDQVRTIVAQITGAPALDRPRLPPQPTSPGTAPPSPPVTAAPRQRRLSVLLVDEDGVGRTLTRLLLEKMGHEVEETDDAKMALEMALMEGPELALISSRIGPHKGLALAWCIHRGGGPAVYLLRSPSERVPEAHIQRAGLRGVLEKPLTPARLEMALDIFMVPLEQDETPVAQAELNQELLAEHLSLLGPERLGQIIDSFLSNAPETLGVAAAAAAEGDVHGLGRAAHKLASGALTVGASTLAAQAKNIDTAAKRQEGATALSQATMLPAAWEQARAALLDFRQRL
jgi:HPt (histidine-containing phosphotransfer) domain-containing protein